MRLVTLVLDFLFPKTEGVRALEKLSPRRMLETLPPSDIAEKDTLALFDYSHPSIKEIVWQIKYSGNRILSDKIGEILYDTMMDELCENNVFEKYNTVILLPIPISDKRRFERGWNQSELLCSAIKLRDSENKFKYFSRQLAKVFHTESQTKTGSRSERRENLKGSMKILNPKVVEGRCVVVVDDVVTTGSTFREAKRVLKNAGAKKILCFAIAH